MPRRLRRLAPGRPSHAAVLAPAVLALTLFACSGLARAQDFDRIAPKLPAPHPAPALLRPRITLSLPASDAVLAPALRGVVFVAGQGALRPQGVPAADVANAFAAPGLPLLEQAGFRAEIVPLLGHPLTASGLDRLTELTRSWYRNHRRPFMDVTAPPQNISSGVVQIVVSEYAVGAVKVSGNRYFSTGLIRTTSGLKTGQTLNMDQLDADVGRLNQNPFLTVNAVFSPGASPGQTDVDLRASDRLPVRVYAGFDNQGVRSLGLDEVSAGINFGNVFGTGQIASYQYNRSLSGRYQAHSVSDVVPLPGGDKLLVFGSYESERPAIAAAFDDTGHSGQASVRYVHVLANVSWLTQDLQLGYDFKTTDNNLEFSGFQIFGASAEVDQFPLLYDATESDRFGQTAVQNLLVVSPGGLTAGNNKTDLRALVPGSAATYAYDRFAITRTTRLPGSLVSITRAIVQGASGNLPDSEELGGGGVGSVRGYHTDTALGSTGELFSQELRLPPFSPSALLPATARIGDAAQAGVFFDYADLRQPSAIPDLPGVVDLASAGFNLHYNVTRFFDLQFDMGWRLRAAPGQTEHGSYGEIAITTGF